MSTEELVTALYNDDLRTACTVAAARDGGRQSILLLIRREGDPRFVALSVAQ